MTKADRLFRGNPGGQVDLGRMRVVATPEHVSCDLEGEGVILHTQTGVYYGLNAVGTRVWSLLQSPRTTAEIRDALLAEYDVDPSECERDVVVLLRELAERRLIAMTPEVPVRQTSSVEPLTIDPAQNR